MKSLLLILTIGLFGLLAIWSGCKDLNRVALFEDTLSFGERLALEEDTIVQFIAAQGYDSVFTTPSGVRVVPFNLVDGELPSPGDILSVHYSGSFINGPVFESSVDAVAIEAGLFTQDLIVVNLGSDKIIAGWNAGLELMKEGQTALVFIPSSLAYGSVGKGSIGPDRALKFELTLVRIRRQ